MARIGKDQHSRILQMVDSEHRKVAAVAAEYGCTPANIYALLSKLRREGSSGVEAVSNLEGSADKVSAPNTEGLPASQAAGLAVEAVPDLFALDPKIEELSVRDTNAGKRRNRPPVAPDSVTDVKAPEREPIPQTAAAQRTEPDMTSLPSRSVISRTPPPGSGKKGPGLGATLAKPGMALMMRTAEGEENLTPFRSLNDLLSAVKPTLRAAARSPDAVWFSVQPVDLASLDSDAA